MTIDFDIRPSLARYSRELAGWRRSRYQDDLRDRRNLVAADGLEAFSAFIVNLSGDDERLLVLKRLSASGDSFTPGQQTSYELGRFRFFDPDTTFEQMLDMLVEMAQRDAGEFGEFGGPQVPGDDPWRHSP